MESFEVNVGRDAGSICQMCGPQGGVIGQWQDFKRQGLWGSLKVIGSMSLKEIKVFLEQPLDKRGWL